jgi:hypothetical protein
LVVRGFRKMSVSVGQELTRSMQVLPSYEEAVTADASSGAGGGGGAGGATESPAQNQNQNQNGFGWRVATFSRRVLGIRKKPAPQQQSYQAEQPQQQRPKKLKRKRNKQSSAPNQNTTTDAVQFITIVLMGAVYILIFIGIIALFIAI